MIHPDIERVALLGWHVYPCSNRTKHGCFKGASHAATCDLNVIAKWTHEYPRCNWRVVCGPSGIWGLDLDTLQTHNHDGVGNFAALVAEHGPIPPRPQFRSGGGGLGIFFKSNGEKIVGKTNYPAPGIDPRRGNLSQTIPPSVHIDTGKPYTWLNAPWEVTPPTAPAWLLTLLEPPPEPEHKPPPIDTTDAARRQLYRACLAVVESTNGARNDTLNRRAFQVGCLMSEGLLGEQEAIEALYGAARHAGLEHHEARATIISGLSSGMRRGNNRHG